MQRLKGRSIVLVALAALACSGDPTGNEGTPTAITANPDVVFVTQGDSQAVLVSVVDEEGQVLQTDVAATNVSSGITVSLDPTFQEVNTGTPIGRQHRFFVKGVDLTNATFTLERARSVQDDRGDVGPGRPQCHHQRYPARARHAGDAHAARPASSSPTRAS